MGATSYSKPAIVGCGAIGTGLAAVSTTTAQTILLARSEASAARARAAIAKACERIEGADPSRLTITVDVAELARCDIVVESVTESIEPKAQVLAAVAAVAPDAVLATTTSSLGISEIAAASGTAGRLFGLHVFNPVPRMDLIEVCFPVDFEMARGRVLAWCEALRKTPIEVPDRAGFIVNRLLFPYLFDAVRLAERTGLSAEDIDAGMQMGAGHPMGPLALLDFVGLDVAEAIGDALYADSGEESHRPPGMLVEMVDAGRRGRKSGAGFYSYEIGD